MLGWGDWGKSEMSGKKVQSWKMGVSYCELSQDIWCWFGGKRDNWAGADCGAEERWHWRAAMASGWGRGANGQGQKGSPWEWIQLCTQHLGFGKGTEAWLWSLPAIQKGEELGPKVHERKKKNGSLWGCRAESPGLLRRLQKGQWGQKEKVSPE